VQSQSFPTSEDPPEQIVRKLREADKLLGDGADVASVARLLGNGEYGMMVAGARSDTQHGRAHRQRLGR
jgi:hypothetical protein